MGNDSKIKVSHYKYPAIAVSYPIDTKPPTITSPHASASTSRDPFALDLDPNLNLNLTTSISTSTLDRRDHTHVSFLLMGILC